MINRIDIRNVATYIEPVTIVPKDINFIYGGNGAGKTTLSRILSDDIAGDYTIEWSDGMPLKTLAFNRGFVNRNFAEGINGIFTLGEEDAESLDKLKNLKRDVEEIVADVAKKRNTSEGNIKEKAAAFRAFSEACWSQKKAFSRFTEALQGCIGSKESFARACLSKRESLGAGKTIEMNELLAIREKLYSDTLEACERLSFEGFSDPIDEDYRKLLSEPVLGSADTPIGAFIDYLENSNWVREGLGYLEKSSDKCPFCQRLLPIDVGREIASYFDDRYVNACRNLDSMLESYNTFVASLVDAMNSCIAGVPSGISDFGLVDCSSNLRSLAYSNINALEKKVSNPSLSVSVEPVDTEIGRVVECVGLINKEIDERNRLVAELDSEKKKLNQAVWSCILGHLGGAVNDYIKKERGLSKGISNIGKQITELEDKKQELEGAIGEIEASRTSITPTVRAINHLLERFGFKGFSLAEDTQNEGMYKIIRPGGMDAKETLSEGEYNFISFLYFYHLVYGSYDKKGIDEPRVVIIDDPISSLDSNVMFIVTTLVKDLVKDCRDGKRGIKQVFVLTHNVYFHKEATFLGRDRWPEKRCLFWVINKSNGVSSVEVTSDNPISTSYELLWGEVRDLGNRPNKNVFNTMRRILEYYFNVVGGWDYEKCIEQFDGPDKVICKALVSCINEGSHMVIDDFAMCFTPESLESYRRVFEKIFENMGHRAHYEMMMEREATIPIQA